MPNPSNNSDGGNENAWIKREKIVANATMSVRNNTLVFNSFVGSEDFFESGESTINFYFIYYYKYHPVTK
jgi:hypothetical protein